MDISFKKLLTNSSLQPPYSPRFYTWTPSFLIFDAPMIIHKTQRCLLTDTHMYVPLEPDNETPSLINCLQESKSGLLGTFSMLMA